MALVDTYNNIRYEPEPTGKPIDYAKMTEGMVIEPMGPNTLPLNLLDDYVISKAPDGDRVIGGGYVTDPSTIPTEFNTDPYVPIFPDKDKGFGFPKLSNRNRKEMQFMGRSEESQIDNNENIIVELRRQLYEQQCTNNDLKSENKIIVDASKELADAAISKQKELSNYKKEIKDLNQSKIELEEETDNLKKTNSILRDQKSKLMKMLKLMKKKLKWTVAGIISYTTNFFKKPKKHDSESFSFSGYQTAPA